MKRSRWSWLLLLFVACAPSLPRPYLEAKAAGHRAYGAGRFDEAASHFRDAAGKAERIRDRDEVLFLEASAYQRANRHQQAQSSFEALLDLSPDGERAARAAHEAALIEIRHGDLHKGWRMAHDLVKRYPRSGLARLALLRYLEYLDEFQGVESTLGYLESHFAWYEAHDLGEVISYQRALRLEQTGALEQARDAFVHCAEKYPYPKGSLFDDSLFRASLVDERLGHPELAVAHLRQMLSVREVSTLHGSYERPRFPSAQMRIAELHRDALGDPDGARREFRKFFEEFRTSVLRDDALWAEARIAAKQEKKEELCESLTLLVKELPESRYAPCARMLCDTAPEPEPPRPCRQYIVRQIEEEQ